VATFAAETNTSSVERRFQAIVVSADPARQTARVRHKPTGFETNVVWDQRSVVKVTTTIDVDDVPAGWVLCGIREADPARKAVARIDRLEPLAESKVPAKADEVKARSTLRCRLVRVPVTPEILTNHNRLLTRDKTLAYALDVNGELWAVEALYQMRPKLGREVTGTAADLVAGMPCKELVYRQEPGRNRLVSALLLPTKKNTMGDWTPTGPSGTQLEQIEAAMAKLRETHRQSAPELRRLMPVRFRLSPEITLPGEPVTLSIESWAQKTPNPEVTLDISYLQPAVAQRRTLSLAWQAGESDDGLTKYTASLALPRLPIGQHCVTWTCDIGGDIPEFWRSFAVADSQTLVVMFHQTPGKVLPDYDELRLPYDHWEHNVKGRLLDAALTGKPLPASAKEWAARATSREYRRRGANINQPASCMLKERTALPYPVHFSDEPEAVQKAYLQAMLELDNYCGFDPQDVGFISYEFGTRSVNVARQAGVRLIGAMCIHQNWMDGGGAGKINHTARPLRPYFAAMDDFRKAGPGGRDALVLVSQHDKSLLWTEYGAGVFEPCWLEWGGLGGGGGRAEVFDEVFMSRHLDLFSAAIDNVVNQRVPYFQSIGMEFTAVSKMVAESNALMIRYAVARARDGKVVFCHQAAAADFYRRQYQETPETLFYDPDYWCGVNAASSVTGGWKPVDYPDLIQIENARYAAYFKKPAALPEYHWDYTKPWNYPDWGNERLPRNPAGFLVPGEHDKFAVTPKITDTRAIKVSQRLSESSAGLEVVVTLETTAAVKALPLALWDIPREWKEGERWWATKGANRFVPIRAPYTGNLNGILEVDAKPGKNEYRLTITAPKHVPQSQDILLKTVHAKIFSRDGQTMAYIWPMQPWETAFELDVPAGKPVQYYAAPKGERVDLKPGKNRLVIAQERWSRIVGLSYEELATSLATFEK
jgi:hypothetical protein